MSTLDEKRAQSAAEAQRQARYDAHRAQKRAIGARARAEARLQAAFEADLLSVHELESRLMAVNKAATVAEIETLLADVPLLDEPLEAAETGQAVGAAQADALARAPTAAVVADVPRSGWAVAILGGTKRAGRWRVPRRLRAFATLGGCELDFTRAELGPETDVHCFALMGGVEIKVPPGVRVEGNGVGILGGFEQVESSAAGSGAPVLRIHGLAVMGGVEIKTVEGD